MNKEIQDKIFAKYPDIFRQKGLPMTESCMCWGLEHGQGWSKIIDNLCGVLQEHRETCSRWVRKKKTLWNYLGLKRREYTDFKFPKVEFSQVKEKMGTLRVYFDIIQDKYTDIDKAHYDEIYQTFRNEINGMIALAEYISSVTCEGCGADGQLSVTPLGWYKTVCEKCAVEKDFKPCKE